MDEKTMALARRAVASKHWRWMPGMLLAYGSRIIEVEADGVETDLMIEGEGYCAGSCGAAMERIRTGDLDKLIADLDDPATQGCLLQLVKDVRGCQNAHAYIEPHPWRWVVITADLAGRPIGAGESYVEALVNALELCDDHWYADEDDA